MCFGWYVAVALAAGIVGWCLGYFAATNRYTPPAPFVRGLRPKGGYQPATGSGAPANPPNQGSAGHIDAR